MTTTQILLSDIASVERFIADIEGGRIQERTHPEDADLRIYSYTKKTQYGGLWTPESKLARGLILRVPGGDLKLATVEGRGLPKFFTVQQSQDDWGRAKLIDDDENVVVDEAPEIPWDLPAIVADKLNGALGLGYIDPSGLFRISTKGSFGSPEALVSNRVLDSKYSDALPSLSQPTGSTMLFEIITPERPHPVDYGDLEDLIFLGTIANDTGAWTPARGDEAAVVNFGFPFAETHEVASLKEAVELPYEDNTEGFVVTVLGGGPEAIYKVKPEQYLQLRKLFYALQDTELEELVLSRAFTDRLQTMESPSDIDLSALVGDLSLSGQMLTMLEARREKIYAEIVVPAQELLRTVTSTVMGIALSLSEGETPALAAIPRGAMAEQIKKQPREAQGLYFAVYVGLLEGEFSKANQAAIKYLAASR